MPYKNREDKLRWERKWKKTSVGKLARLRYRSGEAGKAAHRRDALKWRKNNPEKVIAHFIVSRAIKRGLMTRKPCVICGAKKTHAHHVDYSKPYDVTWLCHIHHMQEHQQKAED